MIEPERAVGPVPGEVLAEDRQRVVRRRRRQASGACQRPGREPGAPRDRERSQQLAVAARPALLTRELPLEVVVVVCGEGVRQLEGVAVETVRIGQQLVRHQRGVQEVAARTARNTGTKIPVAPAFAEPNVDEVGDIVPARRRIIHQIESDVRQPFEDAFIGTTGGKQPDAARQSIERSGGDPEQVNKSPGLLVVQRLVEPVNDQQQRLARSHLLERGHDAALERDPGPEVPQVQLVDEDAGDRRIGRRGLSRGVPGNGKAWLRIRDQRRCVPRDPPAKLRDDLCHPPERIQRPIVPGAAEVR